MIKLKFYLVLFLVVIIMAPSFSQSTGSITVGGDFDKFYPVTWLDGNWNNQIPTELRIGRSNIHENSESRGSVISEFTYHVTYWGHRSNFINAYIATTTRFIAGWQDVSGGNASIRIVIWLRGGGTTYHYNANADVNPVVYDNIQNVLPFNEENGPSHSYKTSIDGYVNSAGSSESRDAYFNGNIGIGAADTRGYRLAVAGNMIAESIKVKVQSDWPDYVFVPSYKMTSLSDVEQFINTHHRLPEIPSAGEVENNGVNLGDMSTALLKKIEELTMHLIQKDKEIQAAQLKIQQQEKRLLRIEQLLEMTDK